MPTLRSTFTLICAIALAGCASDGSAPGGGNGGDAPAASVGGGGDDGAGGPDECRHGMAGMCADGLASELAALPLPPSTDEFSLSSGGSDDPRGSVRQDVYFTDGPEAVADFYEAELEGAGFEVTSVDGTPEDRFIWITTPDGMNGRLHVRSAVDPHGAQMNVEICVVDSCVF